LIQETVGQENKIARPMSATDFFNSIDPQQTSAAEIAVMHKVPLI
jgi:hypothetical protein